MPRLPASPLHIFAFTIFYFHAKQQMLLLFCIAVVKIFQFCWHFSDFPEGANKFRIAFNHRANKLKTECTHMLLHTKWKKAHIYRFLNIKGHNLKILTNFPQESAVNITRNRATIGLKIIVVNADICTCMCVSVCGVCCVNFAFFISCCTISGTNNVCLIK